MSGRASYRHSEGVSVFEKTWERIQIKTFTGWVNSHLSKRGIIVADLFTDFADGLKLAALLEVLGGETVPGKFNKVCKISLHNINNLNFCLKYIASKGVKLVGISAEEILAGNQKLILGMVWTMILRWQIQDISVEEMSAKEALLLWCQKKTEGYDGVSVKNFHTSWQDGLAFCALINRHRPDLLDYNSLDKSDAVGNLNKAFDVAAEQLGIPRLLDANDIVDLARPDERSIITYVSMYFHKFSANQQAETAARRLAKVLDFYQSTEQAKQDYNDRASKLLEWINKSDETYSQREFDNTLEGVERQIGDFSGYKKNEKPPNAKEKHELDALYSAINTKLNLNGRGSFQPATGLSPKELDSAWNRLEKTEQKHNLALQEELRRQRKIRDAVQRFDNKGRRLENWIDQQQEFINTAELGDNLTAVNANVRNHTFFQSEKDAQKNNLTALHSAYETLVGEKYQNIAALQERLGRIDSKWETLGTTGDARKAALDEKQAKLRQLEEAQEEFSKRAKPVDVWLSDAEETLTEPLFIYSSAEASQAASEVDGVVAGKQQRQAELDSLAALVAQVAEHGQRADIFSQVSWEKLQQRWNDLDALVTERRAQIEAEIAKQAHYDTLRKDFAGKATALAKFIKDTTDFVNNLSGTAEEQQAHLQKTLADIQANIKLFDDAQTSDQALEAEHVLENPYTELEFDNLKHEWNALTNLINKKKEALEEESGNKTDAAGLTAEQAEELKECFKHFDKDKDGLLERLEFGAALLALGSTISLEEKDGELDKIIKRVDKDQDGKVNFEEFTEHMKLSMSDKDTPEQVIEAFRTLAGDADFITEAQLRQVLPGDKVDWVVKNAPRKGDGFDYVQLAHTLYN